MTRTDAAILKTIAEAGDGPFRNLLRKLPFLTRSDIQTRVSSLMDSGLIESRADSLSLTAAGTAALQQAWRVQ
jgi:DNA-binding HxlR family transcriptional regulator